MHGAYGALLARGQLAWQPHRWLIMRRNIDSASVTHPFGGPIWSIYVVLSVQNLSHVGLIKGTCIQDMRRHP